jgi:AcrR family transcriptional regulator
LDVRVKLSGNSQPSKTSTDRRVRRTRRALIGAFNQLVLKQRYEDIRIGDIVDAADVGRSTFYEHFAGRDDLHLQALSHPMAILADAAAGQGDVQKLTHLLEHFWENRTLARASFTGPQRAGIARMLAGQIEERLVAKDRAADLPVRLAAIQIADGHLGLVRAWVYGEASATPAVLADAIIKSSNAALAALFEAD